MQICKNRVLTKLWVCLKNFLCEILTWNNLWDIAPDRNYELQKELASYDKKSRIWWVGPGGGEDFTKNVIFKNLKFFFSDTTTWLIFFPRMFQCGFHNQNIIWTRLIYHTIPPPIKTAPPTIGNRAPARHYRVSAHFSNDAYVHHWNALEKWADTR